MLLADVIDADQAQQSSQLEPTHTMCVRSPVQRDADWPRQSSNPAHAITVCLRVMGAPQAQWHGDLAEQSSRFAPAIIVCLQVTRALQVQWDTDLEQQTSRAAAILREISAGLPSPSPGRSGAEQPHAVQGVPQRLMVAADQVRQTGPVEGRPLTVRPQLCQWLQALCLAARPPPWGQSSQALPRGCLFA